MLTSRISVVVATTLAIAAFACSSAPAPSGDLNPKRETSSSNPDKESTPDKNNPSKPGGEEEEENTPGEETPTGGDGAACLQKADAEGCFTCCDAIDPKAFDEAIAAADACLCGANGACNTQCANSICKGAEEPDAACGQCLDSQAAAKCEDTFFQTCESKASCKTVLACEDKCAEKFPQRRGPGGRGG